VVSGVRRMNEVNARRARIVSGWVTVAQPGFGGGGHRGSGERKSPSGVQGQSPWCVVRGDTASRKLIAVIKDIIVKKLNSLKHLVRTTVAESHN